jgi:hypothetical protein
MPQARPRIVAVTFEENTMNRFLLIAMLLVLSTGCAQLPPPPEDASAKRFESLPGKAVIYLARHALEPGFVAPVAIDDTMIGSTYRGTFMRIEVPAGNHILRGMAGDNGSINLATEAGQLYFVQHRAHGYRGFVSSSFDLVDAAYGRELVMGGQITALVRLQADTPGP